MIAAIAAHRDAAQFAEQPLRQRCGCRATHLPGAALRTADSDSRIESGGPHAHRIVGYRAHGFLLTSLLRSARTRFCPTISASDGSNCGSATAASRPSPAIHPKSTLDWSGEPSPTDTLDTSPRLPRARAKAGSRWRSELACTSVPWLNDTPFVKRARLALLQSKAVLPPWPEWRNGRRSRLKICQGFTLCGFKSHLRHHLLPPRMRSWNGHAIVRAKRVI